MMTTEENQIKTRISYSVAQNAKILRVANSTTFTHSDLTAVRCRKRSIEFSRNHAGGASRDYYAHEVGERYPWASQKNLHPALSYSPVCLAKITPIYFPISDQQGM
jgi:hypothetical protein